MCVCVCLCAYIYIYSVYINHKSSRQLSSRWNIKIDISWNNKSADKAGFPNLSHIWCWSTHYTV